MLILIFLLIWLPYYNVQQQLAGHTRNMDKKRYYIDRQKVLIFRLLGQGAFKPPCLGLKVAVNEIP